MYFLRPVTKLFLSEIFRPIAFINSRENGKICVES